ncbi:MAG: uncharacterized protein A8A55_3001 [Amphiamblys sp. WSBS2006]|nr:MAG: uncharacterized protein A8A55_3001 [Amphiamblys sp. WSBS2006]
MFDLAQESFAKQGDNFFLEKTRGVLIVSEAVFKKKYKDIQEKKWFLFSKRQEVLPEQASFLLRCDLQNEEVFLTEKTTVTLSNIEISTRLFFVLLFRTRVTVGERFSITRHVDNEDCIREHGMARNSPVWLGRNEAVPSLVLENIERMPLNSVGCSLQKLNLRDTGLINILPKLRINGDCEVGMIWLYAPRKEHVAAVLAQKKPFCVGRVRKMDLEDYAVGIITKMILKDCEIERLRLDAGEEAHVAAVLKQEKPFCVGRVKNMVLQGYAASVITKMSPKDCEFESLILIAPKEEHFDAVLKQKKPFCDGGVKIMHLWDYAVGVITKMSLKDCEIETLGLYASEEAQVAEVLKQENPFCVGRVKNMRFEGYAVDVITKMSLKDCEFESLILIAPRKEHVAAVLKQENKIRVGRVKNMVLAGYTGNVITKMTFHKDNTMESFVLDAGRNQLSRILKKGDNSIDLGRIRLGGFHVPERRIGRKFRYTLVDGEGKEVTRKCSRKKDGHRDTLFPTEREGKYSRKKVTRKRSQQVMEKQVGLMTRKKDLE